MIINDPKFKRIGEISVTPIAVITLIKECLGKIYVDAGRNIIQL